MLQGVEHTLAQQRECCSPVAHAFDEFQRIDFSLDDAIAVRQSQASRDRRFVSFNPSNKALEFGDLAVNHLGQPGVKVFSCASAQHLSKLLNEVVGQVHFWMALAKPENGPLLLFVQVFRPPQEQKGHMLKGQRSRRQFVPIGPVLLALGKMSRPTDFWLFLVFGEPLGNSCTWSASSNQPFTLYASCKSR